MRVAVAAPSLTSTMRFPSRLGASLVRAGPDRHAEIDGGASLAQDADRMSDDILWSAAADISRLFSRGALSPVEMLELVLKRAERLQPHLNFLVLSDPDGARAAARASEARWRNGEALSPLDGVPTSIKDTTPVKGWPTRIGSHATDETAAAEDAPVVARLRRRDADHWQEHDSGVRLEGADRFASARYDAQPLESRPFARRLVRRRLVDDGGGRRAVQ